MYGNAKISARLICPGDALIVRSTDFQRLSTPANESLAALAEERRRLSLDDFA